MTIDLRDARIGYGSYSPGFTVPGDRRRFSAYAAMRGLSYERARIDGAYDVVYLTHNSDLPGWIERKRREGDRLKIVFELIDAYFTQTNSLRSAVKGLARYATGVDSRFAPGFTNTLEKMCAAADAVVCSTLEQREVIGRYNDNVFISFDHFGGDLGRPKKDHSRAGKLRIVWEGQAVTIGNLQILRGALNALKDRVELHVVTDPLLYRTIFSKSARPVLDALQGIDCPKFLHPWEMETFSDFITACDLAIIPIDTTDAMHKGKPENKLALLWQLGMPVLVSPTPAYQRAMAASGLDMTCSAPEEWRAQLERMIALPAAELERIGRAGRAYAETVYSAEQFAARFDAAFASVGLPQGLSKPPTGR
jgi:glycosyltransferase involved in cell wall biosynthesis